MSMLDTLLKRIRKTDVRDGQLVELDRKLKIATEALWEIGNFDELDNMMEAKICAEVALRKIHGGVNWEFLLKKE